jgi:hypothetical protein
MQTMNQKTREQWVIPIIVSLATGALLLMISLYINAWATGVSLRPPFTLEWIKSILLVPLPLWVVLLFVAVMAGVLLYLRQMAKKKSGPAVSTSGQRPTNATKRGIIEYPATIQESAEPPLPILSIGQSSATPNPTEQPASSFDGDSLVIKSPDQFSLRISKVESGTIRGIQLQIENDRLTSIHKIRIILSSACSFDSQRGAFREASLSGQTFTRPDVIRPSCSGQPMLLVWKAAQWAGLVTGENNFVRQLLWPDRDKSDIERWKLSLSALAFDWSPNPAARSIPLKEINTDFVVLWARAQNEFSIEKSSIVQIPPVSPAAFPINGKDGVSRTIVRYIMCGQNQLLAYTTTREKMPGTRYLVVRMRPSQEPQSVETPDRDRANARWNEWYQEWKSQGFGGASGTGLDGASPFQAN